MIIKFIQMEGKRTNSNTNCDSDASSLPTSRPYKKHKATTKTWYNQPFCYAWLQDEDLKDWIQPDPNNRFVVHCKVCNASLTNANKTALMAHKVTKKHSNNFELKKNASKITSTSSFAQPEEMTFKDKVAKAELLLTEFMAEHDIPFALAEYVVDCLQNIFPDSDIAKSMTMKPHIMQDGIGISQEKKDDMTKVCQ